MNEKLITCSYPDLSPALSTTPFAFGTSPTRGRKRKKFLEGALAQYTLRMKTLYCMQLGAERSAPLSCGEGLGERSKNEDIENHYTLFIYRA